MKGTHIWKILLALAALAALVLSWATIARSARNPVMGDWVPDEDPGTILVLAHDGRTERFAFGPHNHQLQVHSRAEGYTRIQGYVRTTREGVLPPDDMPIGIQDLTFGSPLTTTDSVLAGGFEGPNHWLVVLQLDGGKATKVTLAPPIDVRRGTATSWQPLAALHSLGVVVEWQQTQDELLVRIQAAPGAPPLKWHQGLLQVLEVRCQFATDGDHQVARVPLASVPSLADGPRNVVVDLSVGDDGLQGDVRVK